MSFWKKFSDQLLDKIILVVVGLFLSILTALANNMIARLNAQVKELNKDVRVQEQNQAVLLDFLDEIHKNTIGGAPAEQPGDSTSTQ